MENCAGGANDYWGYDCADCVDTPLAKAIHSWFNTCPAGAVKSCLLQLSYIVILPLHIKCFNYNFKANYPI